MSLESVKRFRDATKENCLKLSLIPNYGSTKEKILKYVYCFVDDYQNGGFVFPEEFYRLAYNKSVEMLEESKQPTKKEIEQEMNLHNEDEVGIDNQWTFEETKYFLLLSDKYQ